MSAAALEMIMYYMQNSVSCRRLTSDEVALEADQFQGFGRTVANPTALLTLLALSAGRAAKQNNHVVVLTSQFAARQCRAVFAQHKTLDIGATATSTALAAGGGRGR